MADKWQIPVRVIPKKVTDTIVAMILFLAVGFFPAALTHNFSAAKASLALSVCAMIPYGITSRTIRQGLLRGLGLGLMAAAGLLAALIAEAQRGPNPGAAPLPLPSDRIITVFAVGLSAMCGLVGTVFARASQRRRQEAERSWKNQD
ncbi:MAG: hypothetical protein WC869_09685 [Phycisphaerae bacterium]|jgi:hypothetical protein